MTCHPAQRATRAPSFMLVLATLLSACAQGVDLGGTNDFDSEEAGAILDGEGPQASLVGVGTPRVRLNEIESSSGTPGDWVELYNSGRRWVDLSGWVFKDGDDTHVYAIPNGTWLAPKAYLVIEESSLGFGLGSADSARLFRADGLTLVDSFVWSEHAATSYGICPDAGPDLTLTTFTTKGERNDCSELPDAGTDAGTQPAQVTFNEVESSGGSPGDWAELYNAGGETADLSGFVFKDADDSHAYTLPSGTLLEPGAFLVLEEEELGFGLGGGDSVRLFDSTGIVLVDSYTWSEHALVAYGRCPDGVGPFGDVTSATKGAANDCTPANDGGVEGFLPWPTADAVAVADEAGAFPSNLSDLSYQPGDATTKPTLWAVQNGPSLLYRLEQEGSTWRPVTSDGWGAGKTLLYPDGTGSPDAEGATRAEANAAVIYVAAERNNEVSSESRMSVLRFDVSSSGDTLTATHEWDLTADLPVSGPNLGLEAITWVPDSHLVARAFKDESTGLPYDPNGYPQHGSGLFFVGLESSSLIVAYALDHDSETFTRIATLDSGLAGVMSLEFDRDTELLWSYCDSTCGNRSVLFEVASDPTLPAFGSFELKTGLLPPMSLGNLNNEGITMADDSACSDGKKPFFWSDDSATGGHALRAGTVPCGRFF